MTRRLIAAAALILGLAANTSAQPTVFLVRHAERADGGSTSGSMMAADPDLSGAGTLRAQALARMLKDAKITAIYTTEFKRTKQTAAPLATLTGVRATEVSSKDLPGLLKKIRAGTGNVLVVGHSNTIPAVLKDLGIAEPVTIDDAEYDNLLIVTRGTLVRLRY
jgi:broad specificity phosphatase PhoE